MKNLSFYIVGVLLLAFPFTTHAAWWNVSEWFNAKTEIRAELPSQTVSATVITQDASTTDLIALLKEQNESLKAKVAALESKAAKVCPVTIKTVTVPAAVTTSTIAPATTVISSSVPQVVMNMYTNSQAVKSVKTSLAQLSAVDIQLKTFENTNSEQVYGQQSQNPTTDFVALNDVRLHNLLLAMAAAKYPNGSPIFGADVFLPHIVTVDPYVNNNLEAAEAGQ